MTKHSSSYTKQDILDLFLSLPKHNRPELRKHISDSVWLKEFGNFSALKQAAGLETHSQKEYTKHIAKHAVASTPTLKSYNELLNSYAEQYKRKDNTRFKTVMVISDVHATMADSFTIDVFLDASVRVKPTHIVISGDLWDFPHFSNYLHDPRKHSAVDELVWVHNFLTELRSKNPTAQITITQGNHDLRIFKHLVEKSPYVADVLDKFSNITPSQLLKLDELQINYVARTNLAVYKETDIKKEVAKNFIVIGDTILIGHYPSIRKHGLVSYYGHHHSYRLTPDYNYIYGAFNHTQLGCACAIDASYTDDFDRWTQGFAIVTVDSDKKRTFDEYVNTTNDIAICGGKYYYRDTV